jgi:CBS domain-containing protein
MSIQGLISRDLLRAAPDSTLADIAGTMLARDAGSMLIFDGPELAGVITLRDIVRAALQQPDIRQVAAREYLTPDPWVVPLDSSPREVATRMLNHAIEHAPVVAGGKVVGVVSSFDLLAYLALEDDGAPAEQRW